MENSNLKCDILLFPGIYSGLLVWAGKTQNTSYSNQRNILGGYFMIRDNFLQFSIKKHVVGTH